MHVLQDALGREFSYLRLSLTERCNFRCRYCLPNGYLPPAKRDPELSLAEIRRLVSALAGLGFSKVRLTGGEPTLRTDLCAIAECITALPGIEKLALTTNGFRLKKIASDLFQSGVRALNVSIDSLEPTHFATITGRDRLHDVLDGIQAAFHAGFSWVKVNTVLLRHLNDGEIDSFLDWVRNEPITVRFIELMQTGDNLSFFKQHHLAGTALREKFEADGWTRRARTATDGPAIEYVHPDFVGSIGLITPYCQDFCVTCNRLRVSSQGALKLCLFGDSSFTLRDFLQDDSQKEDLQRTMQELIVKKAPSHLLANGRTGVTSNLSIIGG